MKYKVTSVYQDGREPGWFIFTTSSGSRARTYRATTERGAKQLRKTVVKSLRSRGDTVEYV